MSYLKLGCEVKIGKVLLRSVTNIRVRSHFDVFTDTAEITIPRNISTLKGENIRKHITEGDVVSIKLGYNQGLYEEFTGYVREIGIGEPMVIKCEDEMYKLKELSITKSWSSVSLEDLIKEVAKGYEIQVADVQLGKFQIYNASPLKVFEELKSKYPLRFFFIGKVLHVDLSYHLERDTHNVVFQKNVRASSVQFTSAEENKLQIKATSHLKNGKREIVYVGDSGGDTKTLNFFNLTRAQIKELAEVELRAVKNTGLKGSITTWGVQKTKHSDLMNVQHLKYPEYDGLYLLDGVDIEFGQNGFMRVNKLGLKVK